MFTVTSAGLFISVILFSFPTLKVLNKVNNAIIIDKRNFMTANLPIAQVVLPTCLNRYNGSIQPINEKVNKKGAEPSREKGAPGSL